MIILRRHPTCSATPYRAELVRFRVGSVVRISLMFSICILTSTAVALSILGALASGAGLLVNLEALTKKFAGVSIEPLGSTAMIIYLVVAALFLVATTICCAAATVLVNAIMRLVGGVHVETTEIVVQITDRSSTCGIGSEIAMNRRHLGRNHRMSVSEQRRVFEPGS